MISMYGTQELAVQDEVAASLISDMQTSGCDAKFGTDDGRVYIWDWNEDPTRPHADLIGDVGAILTMHEDGSVSVVRHENSADLNAEWTDIQARAECWSWVP